MNRPRFASDRPTFGGQKRGARCGKPTCAAAALLADRFGRGFERHAARGRRSCRSRFVA
ncbi:hypothetical protein C7S16_1428 [Burkholderia thailandensis]|uniref:Uncharacterized protein n=1 Tax=Burkholderia thailandensis TaxID=57975 RepID=A0AAW9D0G3_BURTH|nr:hypothetical protein [Burkholderia thailandensis]MDW9256425.1 hypothetical protein [Burkholderia thailandensis]